MRQQAGAAHIVNTGSISGCGPYPRPATMAAGAYITSKYAVVGLSESLRDELEPEGIGVTVLCPAGVRSRIFDAARNRPKALGGPASAPVAQWEGMEPREIGRMPAGRGPRGPPLRLHGDLAAKVHRAPPRTNDGRL